MHEALKEEKDILTLINENLVAIIIFAVIVIFGIVLTLKRTQTVNINQSVEKLTKEKESIQGLVKNAQIRYYQEKSMTKEDFGITNEMYKERVDEIEKEISVLKKRFGKKYKENDKKM